MHIVEADAELDFAIAQDVGVRSAPRGILIEEMRKYAFAVLGREAHPMQRNAERFAHPPRILKVRGGGAVSVLVIVPIGHEEALHLESGFPQQQGRNG